MTKLNFILAAIVVASSTPTFAQKAGSWSASIGVTKIAPDVTSGNLSAPSLPSTKVDVGDNTQLTGAVNYSVTDDIVISVPLGFGFKHKVVGASAIAGVGTLATTKALPITVLGQYRFGAANATARPYVGAGLSYVKFYDTNSTAVLTALTNPGGPATTMRFESKFAPTIQLGLTYNINDKWYLDGNYTKTFLKTRGTLSTGQTLDAKLNPDGYTFQIGYKF
ncbi:MAG: OmpW/AlkL family protein [Brachymonas sp.]